MRVGRRTFLASIGASGLLAGCGGDPQARTPSSTGPTPDPGATDPSAGAPGAARRIRYGEDQYDQFADLRMPATTPLATVVLLHGGYWRPGFGLELMDPLADRFTALGFATWNVEYRRTDAGGGVPATLADVAAAVDRLSGTGLPAGLTRRVVLVGHSAGGHLAAWAASRSAATPGGLPTFPLRGSLSLSGVLDLTRAAGDPGSSDPVTDFVGGGPDEVPEKYAAADPTLLVPAACPVWALHADDDATVPAELSERYVGAARAAGGTAELVMVPGDHLSIIDPAAESFAIMAKLVQDMAVAGPR